MKAWQKATLILSALLTVVLAVALVWSFVAVIALVA